MRLVEPLPELVSCVRKLLAAASSLEAAAMDYEGNGGVEEVDPSIKVPGDVAR